MPRIRIVPLNVEIDAATDATVMGAAQAAGYYWPTTCGGEGRCTTCACDLLDGEAIVEPMGRTERKTLVAERGEGGVGERLRLACQMRFAPGAEGTVVVRKQGVRPPA